jgi:hypothetical protein
LILPLPLSGLSPLNSSWIWARNFGFQFSRNVFTLIYLWFIHKVLKIHKNWQSTWSLCSISVMLFHDFRSTRKNLEWFDSTSGSVSCVCLSNHFIIKSYIRSKVVENHTNVPTEYYYLQNVSNRQASDLPMALYDSTHLQVFRMHQLLWQDP